MPSSGKLPSMQTQVQVPEDHEAARAIVAHNEYLGIDPLTVVAFGDAENDIEMFKVSGASVAMGQADEFVKSAATTITAPNTDHGVAQAIERLLSTGQP